MAPGQFTKLSKFVMRWQSRRSRSQAVQENLLLQTRLCLRLQVHWFQQQHEKKRKKRDFGAASYAFADYPPFFSDFGPRPRPRQATVFHRQRNRGLPLQNLFTDPLFKEQWYLVSMNSNWMNTNCHDGVRDGNRTNHETSKPFNISDYFFSLLGKSLSMMSVWRNLHYTHFSESVQSLW